MKVIHIFNELKFSGAEIMYVDAAPTFQQLGCQLIAVNTSTNIGDYSQYFRNAGYEILHLPYPSLKNIGKRTSYFYNFIKLLKRDKIDVVHVHNSSMKWVMSMCAWLAGKKSIYTFHNVYKSNWYSITYHQWLRWSAKNVFKCKFHTISDSVYNNELTYYNNPTSKVYNWYNSERFSPGSKEEKRTIRQELNIPDEALVLISIGGCSSVKRHSEIIKALPIILEHNQSCIYLHLGEGSSEGKEISLVKEYSIEKSVRFYGNQADVRKYLIASDIYLMTSRFEGISITTIEAMACKIPTILYNVPGLRDFNKSVETSILIPEEHTLLAEKVTSLYYDKNFSVILAERAKAYVDKTFNLENNAMKIYEMYI
ncbi:glycosyltransferase [Spirosoma flavum]|uniref:Glycosyltransferase n=1 Tax=Spirosoma flavum TaxID=2048557 RepID=A0ABW6AFF7_9BACT